MVQVVVKVESFMEEEEIFVTIKKMVLTERPPFLWNDRTYYQLFSAITLTTMEEDDPKANKTEKSPPEIGFAIFATIHWTVGRLFHRY